MLVDFWCDNFLWGVYIIERKIRKTSIYFINNLTFNWMWFTSFLAFQKYTVRQYAVNNSTTVYKMAFFMNVMNQVFLKKDKRKKSVIFS